MLDIMAEAPGMWPKNVAELKHPLTNEPFQKGNGSATGG